LILLVWWAARLVSYVLRPMPRHPPTPHVDAWSVAGKRFQLEEEEADDEESEGEGGPQTPEGEA
jgi:hypothetical protein